MDGAARTIYTPCTAHIAEDLFECGVWGGHGFSKRVCKFCVEKIENIN